MRTTITLDDDVAERLQALQVGPRGWSRVVNEILRLGLDARADAKAPPRYVAPVFDLGGVRPGVDLDKIASVLETSDLAD